MPINPNLRTQNTSNTPKTELQKVIQSVKANVWSYESLPDPLKKNPEILKVLKTHSPGTILRLLSPELLKQKEFSHIEKTALNQNFQNYFALSDDSALKKEIDNKLINLGLNSKKVLSQIFNYSTYQKLVDHRLQLLNGPANLNKKVTVIFYPTTDHNKAFEDKILDTFANKNHHFIYFEVKKDAELFDSIKLVASKYKIQNLIIGGHGNKENLKLGESPSIFSEGDYVLDVDDVEKIKNMAPYLQNSKVFLQSCATAEGGDDAHNLTNAFQQACPECEVTGATDDFGQNEYIFNGKDELIGARYSLHGKDLTYKAKK